MSSTKYIRVNYLFETPNDTLIRSVSVYNQEKKRGNLTLGAGMWVGVDVIMVEAGGVTQRVGLMGAPPPSASSNVDL